MSANWYTGGMAKLGEREAHILDFIVRDYVRSALPVSSGRICEAGEFEVSPATIRNEMVELAKKSYLKKTHFSSGRVPSAKGFRFYIKHLMKQKDLSTTDEVAYKNSIWDERAESHRLLSQAVKVLSQRTGLLSLVTTNDGDLYYSGMANLLTQPEFLSVNICRILCFLVFFGWRFFLQFQAWLIPLQRKLLVTLSIWIGAPQAMRLKNT